jgi:hypothetical protein
MMIKIPTMMGLVMEPSEIATVVHFYAIYLEIAHVL